jgi:hypothetical protein
MTEEMKPTTDWELYLKSSERCMSYAHALGVAIGHLKSLRTYAIKERFEGDIDKAIADVEALTEKIYG